MLEPEFVARHASDTIGASLSMDEGTLGNLTERTPLVLTRSIFMDEPTSDAKRVRRSGETDVKAYFYYDQYPSDGASDKNSARLRLNELVEVVAIATPPTDDAEHAPVLSAQQQGNLNDMLSLFRNDDLEESMADHNRLPLWHVLWFRRVRLMEEDAQRPIQQQQQPSLPFDVLSAWLHSHAQRRSDGNPIVRADDGSCLGCVSLEWVVSHPTTDVPAIVALLQPACPVVRVITTPDGDDDELIPERKATGRLQATPLQLPPGAIVVIDATKTSSAKNKNPALVQLCQQFQLEYRFAGGVSISMEADYRIVVVSSPSTRGTIPCTLTLQSAVVPSDWTWEPCTMVGNIQIPKDLLDEPGELPSPRSALDRCLLLARLQAARRNSAAVEKQDWKTAVALDRAVREEEATLVT